MKESMYDQQGNNQKTIGSANNRYIGDVMQPELLKELVRTARERMETCLAQKNIRYYRASLKASRMIFAYEGDKQILLRMLGEQAKALGYEVLAFSLLDDELQVLLCRSAERERAAREAGQDGTRADLMNVLRDDYEKYYFTKRGGRAADCLREEVGWKRVKKGDILSHCQEIHELPVKEHYVSSSRDFWWSSQNSYYGKYTWHFLNIWRIMSSISRDPLEAIRMYRSSQNS